MPSMIERVKASLIRLPTPYGTTGPARVDQPDFRLVVGDSFRQQLGVLSRMPDEERTAKTG